MAAEVGRLTPEDRRLHRHVRHRPHAPRGVGNPLPEQGPQPLRVRQLPGRHLLQGRRRRRSQVGQSQALEDEILWSMYTSLCTAIF